MKSSIIRHPGIARIALDVPVETFFDFLAPDVSRADIGRFALVPFGKRKTVGVIVSVGDRSDVPEDKMRSIERIANEIPVLSEIDIALFRFCADYYHHPLGQVILNAVPIQFRSTRPFRLPPMTTWDVTHEGATFDVGTLSKRAIVQHRVLELLRSGPLAESAIVDALPRARIALRALRERGLIARASGVAPRPQHISMPGYSLNEEQSVAVAQIAGALGRFHPFLLSGITGSGKTEVYLGAIGAALAHGDQALVLVPEINLTPQLEAVFRARFPEARIVSMHSHLARVPRLLAWLEAQAGHAHIVLGTRLAVFAPLPGLGLIIVDEEHDTSFKQQDGLRYSARDVAVYRAHLAGCPVVLGSATPSLESWFNSQHRRTQGEDAGAARYCAIALTRRANPDSILPTVHLIDTGRERCHDGIGASLLAALKARLERREQSLLFINRRGFSPALICRQCAWTPECRNCSARMVYHKADAILRCHHCGNRRAIPGICASCGSSDLAPAGEGTQRIEDSIAASLPGSRIARVDRDSMRVRGSAKRVFDAARRGDIDILVGTQMLAKGHDFPNLTLVGVLNADAAMFSADFRAPERLFSQLVQVAGRAGRAGLRGEVLIQTRFPSHPIYFAAMSQDYAQFARLQLEERRLSGMPPYSYLALLRAEGRIRASALEFAAMARQLGSEIAEGVTLFDAVPSAMERRAGWERAQVLVRTGSRAALQRFVSAWRSRLREAAPRGIRWVVDIDPIEI